MLTIRNTGSIADVIASVRDVPARVIPYAASIAMTRSAQAAQKEVRAEMLRVFDRPTPYTLNSMYIEPASITKLEARIAVKNQPGSGVRPENFLYPEVDGGGRKAKGFESAMRGAGFLKPGMFIMPGKETKLDQYGNVSGSNIRSVMALLANTRGTSGKKLRNSLFVGKPAGGTRPDGIWRREGKRLRPLFIFTSRAPHYAARLDFTGVVQSVVLKRFSDEFYKSVTTILSKARA
mgnify:CR=1 FL=1